MFQRTIHLKIKYNFQKRNKTYIKKFLHCPFCKLPYTWITYSLLFTRISFLWDFVLSRFSTGYETSHICLIDSLAKMLMSPLQSLSFPPTLSFGLTKIIESITTFNVTSNTLVLWHANAIGKVSFRYSEFGWTWSKSKWNVKVS